MNKVVWLMMVLLASTVYAVDSEDAQEALDLANETNAFAMSVWYDTDDAKSENEMKDSEAWGMYYSGGPWPDVNPVDGEEDVLVQLEYAYQEYKDVWEATNNEGTLILDHIQALIIQSDMWLSQAESDMMAGAFSAAYQHANNSTAKALEAVELMNTLIQLSDQVNLEYNCAMEMMNQ